MRNFWSVAIIILLMFALNDFVSAQNLKRRARLGAVLLNINDSIAEANKMSKLQGCCVPMVLPGSSAEKLGLKAGDVILNVNGQDIVTASQLSAIVSGKKAGDEMQMNIVRKGKSKTISGKLLPYPEDKYENADVIYDEVPFGKGYLRSILIHPKGKGPFPLVFFIQGYNCVSIDNMGGNHPYEKLLTGLVKKGYAVCKVEKPGMGDCDGTPACAAIDFRTELSAFEAAYAQLDKYEFVRRDAVFIFGHSMGGIIAPLMKKKIKPAGIAVYGTVTLSWFEYFVEQFRIQNFISGEDYRANDSAFALRLKLCYEFMILKKSPEELAQNPVFKSLLEKEWGYLPPNLIFDRDYHFWQQLQDFSLIDAWANCDSRVLSIWGACDFVAFSEYDHQLIAEIVNQYHPGMAQYLRLANSDHAFTRTESLRHSAENWGNGKYRMNNFNPAIIDTLDRWMQETMKN